MSHTYAEEHYTCIDKMKESTKDGKTYFQRWATLKNIYQPILNTDLFIEGAQYTPHDYDRHCINIYNILHILIPSKSYGRGVNQLNTEDLFILNVAVLLHDIFMVYSPSDRDTHGEDAQKFIRDEVIRRNNSALSNLLSDDEAKFIGDVIYGHCDIKQGAEVVKETLPSLPESNFKQGFLGKGINVKLLASLLRFADELDINSERIRLKRHLDKRIEENSKIHWRKCKLFSLPTKGVNDVTLLNLRLNEDEINTYGDMENDVKLILEVKNKISDEFNAIKRLVFNRGYLDYWQINTIGIYTDDQSIAKMIKKVDEELAKNPFSLNSDNIEKQINSESENENANKEANSEVSTSPMVKITPDISHDCTLLNNEFSIKLQEIVLNYKYLKDGHFYIGNNTYARDFIETLSLLSHPKYLEEISNHFIGFINSNYSGIPIQFIGEGFPGLILSSNIAFKTNKPFTYFVPDKDSKIHTNPEKAFVIKKDHKLILVTDVIVYGNTVRSAIEFLNENFNVRYDDILCILSVFYRRPLSLRTGDPTQLNEKVKNKLVVMNDNIKIEICSKENCLFRDHGLIKHKYESDII